MTEVEPCLIKMNPDQNMAPKNTPFLIYFTFYFVLQIVAFIERYWLFPEIILQ
jgi:hypothetical protein